MTTLTHTRSAPSAGGRPARCAVYLRISLDPTGDHLAVDRQREDCLAIAAARGWTVVGEYVDNSVSAYAKNTRRPSYDKLVADYAAGLFDALVVYDLDRLTRQPRQLEDWIDAATDRGLLLVSANGEADLSTDAGVLFAGIKVNVARSEAARKGARQRRANLQRAEMGVMPNGHRLTGYDADGKQVPHEAGMVAAMFAMIQSGESLRGVGRWLTDKGYATQAGGKWTTATVRGMLMNPRYAGLSSYRGEVVADATGWEAIITADQFAVVQHRLTDPARRTNEGTHRRWLGSSLYRCGAEGCGERMTSWSGGRYRCVKGCYSRGGGPVDQWVTAVIAERLAEPDAATLLDHAVDTGRAEHLLAEVRRLRGRLDVLDAEHDDEVIDGRRWRASTDRVKAEIAAASAERTRMLAGVAVAGILLHEDPPTAFLNASLMIRREVVDFLAVVTLAKVGTGVKFTPDTVDVHLRTPEEIAGVITVARAS